MAWAHSDEAILTIEGCPLAGVSKTLERAGFDSSTRRQLADRGFAKGRSPVSPEAVREVAQKAPALAQPPSRREKA